MKSCIEIWNIIFAIQVTLLFQILDVSYMHSKQLFFHFYRRTQELREKFLKGFLQQTNITRILECFEKGH